jgi:hypothetical protein
MLGVPEKGIRNPYSDKKKWRVFVQSSCTGNRHLDKDTMVLYEVYTYMIIWYIQLLVCMASVYPE